MFLRTTKRLKRLFKWPTLQNKMFSDIYDRIFLISNVGVGMIRVKEKFDDLFKRQRNLKTKGQLLKDDFA